MPTATEADPFAVPDVERSLAELLAKAEAEVLQEFIESLTEEEAAHLQFDWEFNARRKQQWPGRGAQECGPEFGCGHETDDWSTWAIIAGRGFGKTFTGAHVTRRVAEQGEVPIVHLIAPTPADYRDVMIEGPAGLHAISPKHSRPEWFPTKRLLIWPNGVRGLCFSAQDPEALRGPQCGFLWGDEPGAWTYGQETWDQAQFGLRLGRRPRQVITTTPKPYEWLLDVLRDPTTHLTRGTTYENLNNLAEPFRRSIINRYEGTTLGRQELLAEILEAIEGALWTPALIEQSRVALGREPQTRVRVAVAVDPPVTATEESDECGIVGGFVGDDGELYVTDDQSIGQASPDTWAKRAVALYYRLKADVIVAERNQGGDMVAHTIKTVDPNVRVELVTATRGKALRAEPVAALWEQERAHIVGELPELEDQMCRWVPGVTKKSPDRMDAVVWLGTKLMIDGKRARLIA